MDLVRGLDTKVEERSDAFFDENDEERILAEVQRRYQGEGGGHNARGTAQASSFGKMPELLSTEQFMRDMGVMHTDELRTDAIQDQVPPR